MIPQLLFFKIICTLRIFYLIRIIWDDRSEVVALSSSRLLSLHLGMSIGGCVNPEPSLRGHLACFEVTGTKAFFFSHFFSANAAR